MGASPSLPEGQGFPAGFPSRGNSSHRIACWDYRVQNHRISWKGDVVQRPFSRAHGMGLYPDGSGISLVRDTPHFSLGHPHWKGFHPFPRVCPASSSCSLCDDCTLRGTLYTFHRITEVLILGKSSMTIKSNCDGSPPRQPAQTLNMVFPLPGD